ncbi:MAG: hypothetical protein E6J87_15305 [Deltaproteobacteria bacterium]|nr:MAG: hypothetical protein E6J87_15305 [Deltaproteobacteria bacterium]
MNPACQADDARIARFRTGTALIWFGQLGGMIGEFARRYPGAARGQDVYAIMREVQLPPALRVGQGYGKVSWAVRTIFESYTGWFQRRATSELYADAPDAASADLVELAGAKVVLDRARGRLAAGDPLRALRLAEAVAAAEPASRDAASLLVDVHEALLAAGGDVNFWESGWLHHQIARWRAVADG